VPAGNPSPAAALNTAARQARGAAIAIMIDGARMLSPGVLRYTLRALKAYRRPVVSTLAFHLGPKTQQESVREGYDPEVEDRWLETHDWQGNGYCLFDYAALAPSSRYGLMIPLAESNFVAMPRQVFDELGGLEERFTLPGGGLVNLDFYLRALQLPRINLVTLLGEGTFHQVHGGASTAGPDRFAAMAEEYAAIRGRPFTARPQPWIRSDYLGRLDAHFIPALEASITMHTRYTDEIGHTARYADDPDAGEWFTTSQGRCIAVLGMHRSGTSMLAGSLQEAGVCFGDVVTCAPNNPKGNRESLTIRTLHEDLLDTSGGSWKTPPATVTWTTMHRALQTMIVKALTAESRVWGFKDPRTLLCLRGWIEAVPSIACVGIFRHPREVANSLYQREKLPLSTGFSLWYAYNQRLYEWHRKLGFPLMEYVADEDTLRASLSNIARALELPLQPVPTEWRFLDIALRHQQCDSLLDRHAIPFKVALLYRRLRKATRRTRRTAPRTP